MTDTTAVRDHLVRALQADLVGPYALDDESAEPELLPLPPSRWYLTGFLAPQAGRHTEGEEEETLGAGSDEDEEETQGQDKEPSAKALFPASMGLSVLIPAQVSHLDVTLHFAEYRRVMVAREGNEVEKGGTPRWRRLPQRECSARLNVSGDLLGEDGVLLDGAPGVRIMGRREVLHGIPGIDDGTQAMSVFVVNRRNPESDLKRRDEQFLFQVQLELGCPEGFVSRSNLVGLDTEDWDESVADLHFRDRREVAVGHGVSVEVVGASAPATRVRTTWLPLAKVQKVRARDEAGVEVGMELLSRLDSPEAVRKALQRLPDAYREWIDGLSLSESEASQQRQQTLQRLKRYAAAACARIADGVDLLAEDEQIRRAFCLANRAMDEQARKRSPSAYSEGKRPRWRLFQLAFVLLNLRGMSDPLHEDRERVELIFFPTGGGKTEAYLGVVAFTLLLRRLRGTRLPHGGLGVAVLLRYTLRLLTLDQLQRAATLVCALEMIRREIPATLGEERFAVGLWVGRSGTANTLVEAKRAILDYKNGKLGSPVPLPCCPWCQAPLGKSSVELVPSAKEPTGVRVGCLQPDCAFSASNNPEGIPLVFVDEQLYSELPAFVIGTVDKFAMVPWRAEAGRVFGKVRGRIKGRFIGHEEKTTKEKPIPLPHGLPAPDLIIQDELHLITGPLGTMVGLYETAVDHLCSREHQGQRIRPKVMAATATVRRASRQIQLLYGRRSEQVSLFPPPAMNDSETWFAEVDPDEASARLYLGVAAPGRSMRNILVRVYRTLLAAAASQYDPQGDPKQTADGYMTLAGYFNSLRELGGMRRLVEDEVRARCAKAHEVRPENAEGPHRWMAKRELNHHPVELTSRESTDSIKTAKAQIAAHFADKSQRVDVVLASNMISVGVDIERLGLMVVAGQPKNAAEYIQATSRVGRNAAWPGLVVTCLNLHKPRDRSHYERFQAWHESFYRFVEATSVTPFSGPALERGLAGVLVAMTRFSDPALVPAKGVMTLPKHQAVKDQVVARLAERTRHCDGLDASGQEKLYNEVTARCRTLFESWLLLVDQSGDAPADRCYSPYDRERSGRALLRGVLDPLDADQPLERRFRTGTSMRDVEPTAHLWIAGRTLGAGR